LRSAPSLALLKAHQADEKKNLRRENGAWLKKRLEVTLENILERILGSTV
jgi:hypothetical protein